VELKHNPRGPKGLEVFPEKVGKIVVGIRCHACLHGVPPVEWETTQLTGEERTVTSRNGGSQRKYVLKCTRCGYEWLSTHPRAREVASEDEPKRGMPVLKRIVKALSMPKKEWQYPRLLGFDEKRERGL
jgi:hypothetical protein